MSLGDVASIATLILFVFYFVGRIETIKRTRSIISDDITIEGINYNRSSFNIVETFELENDPYNTFILTSRNGIYDLSVYEIIYDDELNRLERKKLEEHKYEFLNIGQSLEFQCTSPEILPRLEVEYFTPDYKKVTLVLWDNPKNGVMSESATPKHTFKSIMYHLFT